MHANQILEGIMISSHLSSDPMQGVCRTTDLCTVCRNLDEAARLSGRRIDNYSHDLRYSARNRRHCDVGARDSSLADDFRSQADADALHLAQRHARQRSRRQYCSTLWPVSAISNSTTPSIRLSLNKLAVFASCQRFTALSTSSTVFPDPA